MAKVDAELNDLRTAGDRTKSTADEIQSNTNNVLSAIEPLIATGLKGHAGDAFKQWVDTVTSEISTVQKKLAEIGQAIDDSAENYDSSDQDSGSNIQGSGSGVEGIAGQLR